ncbi:hypothetical protein BO94DRAFT_227155 [Aspergillus sclerotioniger CBS 115572]|uniref:Uncharacterized protein n=1 Tax=Aspergillus sclerotioniger CBS 115572 TaxID=1450535 RepID=A0A317VLM3_9EURO|nr:hypothetical protein BO94DRAFT_227155 [Aspergillus sclerotioniger CBS 115572]PWY74469.1 hypothetical protein BO94DRAFT_227155 [Aspergillus sclerotioniger CBS 115572]
MGFHVAPHVLSGTPTGQAMMRQKQPVSPVSVIWPHSGGLAIGGMRLVRSQEPIPMPVMQDINIKPPSSLMVP